MRRKPGSRGEPEAEALTAVDLAAQDVILRRLLETMPAVALDAEEDTELVGRFPPAAPARPLVVVDPIDGTWNYAHGSPDYAVMGALVEGGRYRAAVVHLPERRATWWAIAGRGCHRAIDGRDEIRRADVGRPPPRVLGVPRLPPRFAAAIRSLGLELRISRCSAIDAAAIAIGEARATVDPGPPDRRRAIGFLLTTEAGGVVRVGGEPWDARDPEAFVLSGPTVVAASASLANRFGRALSSTRARSR